MGRENENARNEAMGAPVGVCADADSDPSTFESASVAADAPARTLGDVADELWYDDEEADGTDAFEAFLGWAEEAGITLWPHQEDACLSLCAGNHVILGTPTGSGKTLVAFALHFLGMATDGRRSVYTAPIKALVNEKYFALVEEFGAENVGMITGDTSINPDATIVCCTAEILALQSLGPGYADEIGYVIMDEFHYFGDFDRGWAWQLPLLALPNTQFLLMSATLGDVSQIKRLLEERTGVPVDCILDAPRPVPLQFTYISTPLEASVEVALRQGKGPLYIVHFAQSDALESARSLASYGISTREQREAVRRACKGFSFTTAFGKTLVRLLELGVGVHHAGMLPRYRLLVERLAQRGLLPVICGTDTLGVGINVPIHTVLITSLAKFDGHRERRLKAREFHQIAGRAGRAGFDSEGEVIAQAPAHEIENARRMAKAAGDGKKAAKVKKVQPEKGKVTWDQAFFDKLLAAQPERLVPRFKVTHSMVLSLAEQGGDVRLGCFELIDASLQSDEEKIALKASTDQIIATLLDTDIMVKSTGPDGADEYRLTAELPENFALNQPLSPFLIAALDLLDLTDEDYALDAVSMVEAIVEGPRKVLILQERREKRRVVNELRQEGREWEECQMLAEDVTYPKPCKDLLDAAFEVYCKHAPWALDYEISPKSIVREMYECGDTFKSFVAKYKIEGMEGTLLKYISEVFRVLDRTVPLEARDERLEDIISWLYVTVNGIDSGFIEGAAASALSAAAAEADADAAAAAAATAAADRRGLTILARNALFQRVILAARNDAEALAALDAEWGCGLSAWRQALEEYYEAHEEIRIDADARSARYFLVDESDASEMGVWHLCQIILDEDGDCDFRITADLDLDQSRHQAEAVFRTYRVGAFDGM